MALDIGPVWVKCDVRSFPAESRNLLSHDFPNDGSQPSLWVVAKFSRIVWDSSVRIATGYGLHGQGSIHNRGKRFFSLHIVQTSSGPPSLLSHGQQGHEADHSPPSSAEVKNVSRQGGSKLLFSLP
jgi:hypothetical protein